MNEFGSQSRAHSASLGKYRNEVLLAEVPLEVVVDVERKSVGHAVHQLSCHEFEIDYPMAGVGRRKVQFISGCRAGSVKCIIIIPEVPEA